MRRHSHDEATSSPRQHWLIKSEPSVYPFAQLVADGKTAWTGVRNFTARNHLRAMKKGDACLYYHSNEGKAVVGVARVAREGYPDPTQGDDEDWTAVDVEPMSVLARPVPLAEMRDHPRLGKMMMFRQGRLSVVPVTEAEYAAVLALGADAERRSTQKRPRSRTPAARTRADGPKGRR
jgi:predicted RNA-binding protein with PUA-like domain